MAHRNGQESPLNHADSDSTATNAPSESARLGERTSLLTRKVHALLALTDLCYAIAVIVSAPLWLLRMISTGKIRTDWPARLGRGVTRAFTQRPCIVIHAVSVGEVNAIRGLVARLAADSTKPEIIVSVSTDTGIARAASLFGAQHTVVRTPFDFSFAVRMWLDRLRPDLLVLVELELWPNMTRLAQARSIPVVVVNGRLSDRSIRGYRRARFFVRSMFVRATMVLAQNTISAERFAEMGAEEVLVSGNMKWDSVAIADNVPGSAQLASDLGIPSGARVIVVGSSEPGEEILLRDALLHPSLANVRVIIAPRKPEWFDAVAANLPGCVRRSRHEKGNEETKFYLLDTIGELRMAYALADVVVIGRSFGKLYGSDPIEPASLGKAVVIGPRVADFRDVVETLRTASAIRQVTAEELLPTLIVLMNDLRARMVLAVNARETIRREQGATARTAEILLSMLASRG